MLVATCNEQPTEIFALTCPRKGEHAYVQKAFGNYLRRLQRTKITLQTDRAERAIGGLTRAVLFEMQKTTGHQITVDDPLLAW